MRTRAEVLAELRQRIGTDPYCQSDVNGIDLYAMADHIVATERQRDEYHAMWKQETLAKRELADRIRELEAQQAASEPVAQPVNDPYQLAAPFAWILVKNGKPQGLPVAHRPTDWPELERVWCATFTPLYPHRKSVEVLERQWLEACEMGQAYCKRHGITEYGRSVFALLIEDAERLRAHPSAAGVRVTDEMVEAAAKVGCDNGFDRDFDAPGMYWDAMHKVVTAALTAASEGASA